jgi:hypothetical protein
MGVEQETMKREKEARSAMLLPCPIVGDDRM